MVEMDDATIGFGCDQASAGVSANSQKQGPVSNNETTEIVDEDKRMAAGASQTLNSKKYADDGELYVQLQTKVCISSIGLPEATRRYVAAVRRNCSLFISCCYSVQDLSLIHI